MALIRDIREYIRNKIICGKDFDNRILLCQNINCNILLWGDNNDCLIFMNLLKEKGINVKAIIDNNPDKTGSFVSGISIFGPDRIFDFFPFVILICSYSGSYNISEQLMDMGLLYDIHFAEHPLIDPSQSIVQSYLVNVTFTQMKLEDKDIEILNYIQKHLFPKLPDLPQTGWIQRDNIDFDNKYFFRRPF